MTMVKSVFQALWGVSNSYKQCSKMNSDSRNGFYIKIHHGKHLYLVDCKYWTREKRFSKTAIFSSSFFFITSPSSHTNALHNSWHIVLVAQLPGSAFWYLKVNLRTVKEEEDWEAIASISFVRHFELFVGAYWRSMWCTCFSNIF